MIPVARRLSKPDGTFAGVIVADIDPNYFSRFFQDLDLGPGAVVRLTEDSGRVLLASTLSSGGESGRYGTSVVTQPQSVMIFNGALKMKSRLVTRPRVILLLFPLVWVVVNSRRAG